MPNLSELLDPESYKKLRDLGYELSTPKQVRDVIAQASVPAHTAEDSAKILAGMPRTAAESAETFENALPSVAEKAAPVAEDAGGDALSTLLGKLGGAGSLMGKSALPLTVATELLRSTPTQAAENESGALTDYYAKKGMVYPPGQNLPYGGHTQEAAAQANPGPQAMTGLNPDAPSSLPSIPTQGKRQTASSQDEEDSNEEPNQLQKSLATIKGEPSKGQPSTSDMIKSLLSGQDDQMAAARQAQGNIGLLAMLGRAGQQMGAGFAPLANVKPDEQGFKALQDMAGQPMEQLKAQELMRSQKLKDIGGQAELQNTLDRNDATSPASRVSQELLRKEAKDLGIDPSAFGDISKLTAENIAKDILPAIGKRSDRKMALDIAQSKHDEDLNSRERKNLGVIARSFEKEMNPDLSGNLRDNKKRIDSASRVEALFKQFPDGNVPKAQTYEIGGAVAGLVLGGQRIPLELIEETVPSSLKGKINDAMSWFNNEPKGRDQAAFLQNLKHTAEREKLVAGLSILKSQVDMAQSVKPQLEDYGDKGLNHFDRIIKGKVKISPKDFNDLVNTQDDQEKEEKLIKLAEKTYGAKGSKMPTDSSSKNATANPQTGPHGPSVTQNGHTYNWNPSTGKYE